MTVHVPRQTEVSISVCGKPSELGNSLLSTNQRPFIYTGPQALFWRPSTIRSQVGQGSRLEYTLFFCHWIRMFLARLSPSAVIIELRLVFGGFERMKQARPVPGSGGFRRRSVFLRTSTSVSALWWNNSKDIAIWSFSNLPISVVSSIGGMTVKALDVLENAFWNGERDRHESKPRNTHTHTSQALGQARCLHGWALGRKSSHPPFLLWKLYRKFAKAVLSIHTIFDSRDWNSVKRYFAKCLYYWTEKKKRH